MQHKVLEGTNLGNFLWIGDGGRPTYGVDEHLLRRRWPEADPPYTPGQRRRLHTLDRKPSTGWPLQDTWRDAGISAPTS